MTQYEKLQMLQTIIPTATTNELNVYLDFAKQEIINTMYSMFPPNYTPQEIDVPRKYEMIQVNAVVIGYNMKGAENETSHSENGISRVYANSDMAQYIHKNVVPIIYVEK